MNSFRINININKINNNGMIQELDHWYGRVAKQ